MAQGSVSLGVGGNKAISPKQLARAMQLMPAAMWVAHADAMDHAFRGFWKKLKTKMEIRSPGGRFTLTRPAVWPFEITPKPANMNRPDWSQFRAVMGTDERAALLLETGGIVRPKRKRWIAVPATGARYGKRGKVRPNFTSPHKATTRAGKKFVVIKDKFGKLALHELVAPKAGRGRPRKGAAPRKPQPSPIPAFVLVSHTRHRPRLHFHKTWREDYPNALKRIGQTLGRAVRDVLAGRIPTPYSAKRKAIPS